MSGGDIGSAVPPEARWSAQTSRAEKTQWRLAVDRLDEATSRARACVRKTPAVPVQAAGLKARDARCGSARYRAPRKTSTNRS
jgi:hypothetical protein